MILWSPCGGPTFIPNPGATVSPLSLPELPIYWFKIPQKKYTQRTGDKSFSQLGEITFSVNNVRGINMRNALSRIFTGLHGRDEPVLENANGPVSCRLLVR